MRSKDEIEGRIRFLLAEALKHRVREASRRLPVLCRHNFQQPLDTRRQLHGEPNPGFNRITVDSGEAVTQRIGLCMLGSDDPERWGGTICEDPSDAQRCPLFEPRLSKAMIWQDYHDTLQDVEALRESLPEIYGLIWALEPAENWLNISQVPWWKRFWFWALRI